MLIRKKKKLKANSDGSTIIISVFYFLFILLILGITGSQTDPTALAGLKNFLGNGLIASLSFNGILAHLRHLLHRELFLKKL